jgi:tetratricopeptide (TPR) repeat protein
MKHSVDTQLEYKKYRKLADKYPDDKRYLFEYAMVLAYMGKIEEAGLRLKHLDELDDQYAHKLVKVLEKTKTKTQQDWKKDFKLGFIYYFLFEEANGRVELAQRRIKRATERPDEFQPGTKENEESIIAEKTPLAEEYKKKALVRFEKVANKQPVDSINAWGYAYMAVIRGIEKDWKEAETLCSKALEIEPDAYAIRAAYMEAMRQNGNVLGAAGQMTLALRLKSEQEEYEKNLFGDVIK